MKKGIILVVLSAFVLALGLTACNTQPSKTYESIYNEYSQKLEQATPKLIEEFNQEAAGATRYSDITGISVDKINQLDKIYRDGTLEMAELMNKNKDASELYDNWVNKLGSVCTTEQKKITDLNLEYMNKLSPF